MDERVKNALAQWPNVPDVYGWLSLDRRGRWRLRGEFISNQKLIAFINRNYAEQANGAYAFQNGPQRVFVALEATPWIARPIHPADTELNFVLHTGQTAEVSGVFLSPDGELILQTPQGPALIADEELSTVLAYFCDKQGSAISDDELELAFGQLGDTVLHLQINDKCLRIENLPLDECAQRFGFIQQPAPAKPQD